MEVGNKISILEYDLGEVREAEILNIFKENEDTRMDIITYRYFGKILKVWHYRIRRRFEFESAIEQAEKYK